MAKLLSDEDVFGPASGGSGLLSDEDVFGASAAPAPVEKKPSSFVERIGEFGLDFGKRILGSVASGVASIPLGMEKGLKGAIRGAVTGGAESAMPGSVYSPSIDTDESVFGRETEKEKAGRQLTGERAVSAIPDLPGARALADVGKSARESIHASTSDATQKAVASSQIKGNLFKGEIDFGDDPSVRGFVMQAADVFGSMLPVIATAIATKSPAAGGAVGGAMAAGEGADSARDFVTGKTDAELMAQSPFFASMVKGGATPEEARQLTLDKAVESAALLQGVVASVGDRFTGKLVTGQLDGVLAKAAGKSITGRTAAGAALSSAEEGTQEVTEGVAADLGMAGVVPTKEVGEDSAANLVLGALGGGPAGAARGAVSAFKERGAGAPAPVPAAPPASTPAGIPDPAPTQTAQPAATPSVATSDTAQAEAALLEPKSLTALDRANAIDTEAAGLQQQLAALMADTSPDQDLARQSVATQIADLEQERAAIAATWPAAAKGAPTTFSTEAGVRLAGEYALMDADDLITSHTEGLKPNPLYPAELQPRDRSRNASELQVSGIAQKLDPARLGVSADSATGAPIVGADGLVESGNARTIAPKRIYQHTNGAGAETEGSKAHEYRQFLADNAAQFGLTPEALAGMNKPVLVRVRSTPVNRAEFARQANASTVQRMSPSEQALTDSRRLQSLDALDPTEDGDFSGSRDFIRQFMAALPITEQSDLIESDGKLSTAGYRRIQNAVLARAYGDSPSLRRMTESMDNNLANVSKALVRVAPTIAAARERMDAGTLHQADIAPDLLSAVEGLSALKEKGWTVAQELAQTDIEGPRYSPEASELLQFLSDNIRSPKRIAEFFQRYYEALEQAGDPTQPSMFGDDGPAPARGELLKKAQGTQPDGNTDQDPERGIAGEGAPAGVQAGSQPQNAPGNQGGNQGNGPARADAAGGQPGVAQSEAVEAKQTPAKNSERTNSLGKESSWVIRNKETGEVVMETFDKKKVDALNTEKYEAVPIQEHLASQGAKQPAKPSSKKAESPASKPAEKTVRTYTTRGKEVGAEVKERTSASGKTTYSYTGKWGAGSGIDADTMAKKEAAWREKKSGFTLQDSAPDLDLASPTPAEVVAKQDAAESAAKQKAKDDAKAAAAEKAARDKKDVDSRMDASAEGFKLGQDANDAVSGQGGMFSRAPAKDQTQTTAFKEWFADSAVVDAQGSPLPMYHGTSASQDGGAFTMFDTFASNYGLMGLGAYFTADPDVASSYTTKGKGKTPTVYKTFLSIQRPLDMDAPADAALWRKQFPDAEQYLEGGTKNENWYRAAEDALADQQMPKWEGAEIMQDGLRAMGFDGITHMGGGRVKANSVRHRVYIAFEPEQVKSATGNSGDFDSANPDIRFSRAQAAEVRNLVTLHNLSEENLLYVDRLGGIPAPSIGITKVDSPFGGFGGITLIAPKGMIDPAAGVPVYDRDAWTARFPAMNFKPVKAAVANAFYERMKPAKALGEDGSSFLSMVWERVKNDKTQSPDKVMELFRQYHAARMLYASEVLGKEVKVPMRDVPLSGPMAQDKRLLAYWKANKAALVSMSDGMSTEDFRATPEHKQLSDQVEAALARAWPNEEGAGKGAALRKMFREVLFDDDGLMSRSAFRDLGRDAAKVGTKEIDRVKLDTAVDKTVKKDDPAYLKWAESLVAPLFDAPTITLRGKEVAPTLDNLTQAMTVGATEGVEKSMAFGAGKTAAMLGKRFKSLKEIQSARDQVVSQQQEQEGKKATDVVLNAYREAVLPFFTVKDWRGQIDTWAGNDAAMEALARAGKAGDTGAVIRAALTKMGFKGMDAQAIDLARQAIDALRNAATDYFEAKPQRAVKLDEFQGAVVPKGTSAEALAVLEKAGIAVEEHGKAEGAREKAIQKLAKRLDKERKDVLFSFAGPRAATADKHAMTTAQYRVAAGEDAEQVRKDTGWHQGADGRWRFEISDADAALTDRSQWTAPIDRLKTARDAALAVQFAAEDLRNQFLRSTGESPSRISSETKKSPDFKALEKSLKKAEAATDRARDALRSAEAEGSGATVGLMLDHPALFAAYPEVASVRVEIVEELPAGDASYTYESRAIELSGKSNRAEMLSTLLHEIQHGIQHIEGFASGGSRESAMVLEQRVIQQKKTFYSSPEYKKWSAQQDELIDTLDGQELEAALNEHAKNHPVSTFPRIDYTDTPDRIYQRLAGEVEARNTQARQRLTGAERRAIPPSQTADVPASDVIVVFNGKEMQSAPAPANAPAAKSNERLVATQLLVDGLKENWTRAPEVIVARNMQDPLVPQRVRDYDARLKSQGSDGEARGFIYQGKVYLLSDELKGPQQIAEVLFHEVLGHYGLRGAFGEALTPILNQMATMRRADIAAKAREYGLFDKAALGGMTKAQASDAQILAAMTSAQKREAAEEVLAEMAQTRPELGFVRRAIAAIRNWLRENVPGFAEMKMSDADIVQKFILPARGFVERGGSAGARQASSAFSRGAGGIDIRFSRTPPGGTPQPAGPPAPLSRYQQAKAKVDALTSPGAIDKFLYEFQDKLIDLKRLRAHIKAIGGTVTDLNDAYQGEELYHKRVAKRTQDFLAQELKPLLAGMRNKGVTLDLMESFLHARHAPEANKELSFRNPNLQMIDAGKAAADTDVRDLELALQRATQSGAALAPIEKALDKAMAERKRWAGAQAFNGTEAERLSLSGMSDADAAAVMAALSPQQRADLDALAAQVDAINAKTLTALKDYGLMDAQTLDLWTKTYQHYVPLHRDEAHPDSSSHPIGQGFSVKGDSGKRRAGSNAKVTHILGHIAMQRETALTRGEKNLVGQKLYLMASQNPDPEWWSVDRPPRRKYVDEKTGFTMEGVDPMYKNRPNVVMLRIAGKDAAVVFNKRNERAARLAESLKNLDAADMHIVLGLAAKATRWFASVNTQYNPVFGVINFMRDVQAALLGLGSTPLKGKELQVARGMWPALKGIFADQRSVRRGNKSGQAGGAWGKLWHDMQAAGGTTGYRDLYADPQDRARSLEKAMAELERGNTKRFLFGILNLLNDYNETMEGATRLAAYKVALDSGMSTAQAASLAKNLTVNFNRKGRQAREIGALYAFFNAAVQGTARMVDVLKGPTGKKVMAGGVLMGAMNAMIGMAMMGGDDDDDENGWSKIPEFVRERSLIIPLGREDFVAIPLPLGFNVLPNLGRKAVEAMAGLNEGKSKAAELASMIGMVVNAFSPFGAPSEATLAQVSLMMSPTVLDPAVSLLANTDWTGKPIYRADTNSLDPTPGHLRTKDTASTPSKALSRWLNNLSGGTDYRPGVVSWTPDQLDYVAGQLTGGVGRELMKLNQAVVAPFTGEELPAHKIPLLGRVYGNLRGVNAESGRYYENTRLLNKVENELKGRMRDDKDADGYREEEPLTEMVGRGNQVNNQVTKLRKMRERALAEGDAERVKEIEAQVAETMKEFNREVKSARRSQ